MKSALHPFFSVNDDELIALVVPAGDIFQEYEPLFSESGIYGNGPAWGGLIMQALEMEGSEIVNQISFDSEGDTCIIHFDMALAREKFIEQILPIFSDKTRFARFIQEVDVDRLDA